MDVHAPVAGNDAGQLGAVCGGRRLDDIHALQMRAQDAFPNYNGQ